MRVGLAVIFGVAALTGCDPRRRADIRAWLDPGVVPAAAHTAGATSIVRNSVLAPKGVYRLVVDNVRACGTRTKAPDDPAHELWGVEVELEALTVDDLPVNPFYARLIDSSGGSYPSVAGGCEPHLSAPPLSRTERAHGWIAFRVPRARSGFTLVYAPRVGASARPTEVQISLGR
jgi:hypothetical protein